MHVSSFLLSPDQVSCSLVLPVHDRKAAIWRGGKIVLDEIAFEPAIQHAVGRNA